MAFETVGSSSKALEFFKDWTNYLLVTTVASLGWIATTEKIAFSTPYVRGFCIIAFAFSIVFGIFTLALIPIVQEAWQSRGEKGQANRSIYDMDAEFWLVSNWSCRL